MRKETRGVYLLGVAAGESQKKQKIKRRRKKVAEKLIALLVGGVQGKLTSTGQELKKRGKGSEGFLKLLSGGG